MNGRRRVCMLTGAGGVLGTAFCDRLRAAYDIVAVHRFTPPPAPSQDRALVDPLNPEARLPENEHPVFAVQADVTRPEDVERLVDLALARYGTVDLLVNAAARNTREPVLDADRFERSLREHVEVNVLGPLRLCGALTAACWREDPGGNRARRRNVVNVSSTAGVYLYGGQRQAAYSVSKAALNWLTCHLAEELDPVGVRANVVAPNTFPGLVATERVLDGIVALDAGEQSGEIVLIDEDRDGRA